ncbi:MAG: class I SAM-dependent methyltransferase [Planctomycetia bacterium]|nr:class I SAM-dependent methyltransferase [Planctomycetia bacterium]
MQSNAYLALAATEDHGWYYQARIQAVHTLVRKFLPRSWGLDILDVGCGTGGTSHALEKLGRVTGLEPNALAIGLLQAKYPTLNVVQGTIAQLPGLVQQSSYDLATVMGVLYHRNVADPGSALRNISAALKPDGWIIWNEAAYPFLARKHDRFVQSQRRFYPREMRGLLEEAGFEVQFGSHLLAWAFPIGVALAAAHQARKLVSAILPLKPDRDPADDRPLPAFLNSALRRVTYWEWHASLKRLKFPFGISYLVIARKPAAAVGLPSYVANSRAA